MQESSPKPLIVTALRAKGLSYLYDASHDELVVPLKRGVACMNIFLGADVEEGTVSILSNVADMTIAIVLDIAGLDPECAVSVISLAFDQVVSETECTLQAVWSELSAPSIPPACIVCQAAAIADAAFRSRKN